MNANLVIWGDYKSKCEWDSTKIRVRYSIVKDSPYFIKEENRSEYESISDITQIEEGVLTGSIEDLIYIILGLKAWNVEKSITKTLYYLNKVDKRSKAEYVQIYTLIATAYTLIAMKKGGSYIDSSEYYFNKAIEISPNEKGIYFNRGVLNKSIGCYQDALNDFNKFILLDDTSVLAYQYRGEILLEMKLPEMALLDYERALLIDSTKSEIYEVKGNLYQELKDFSKALLNYNHAIKIDPKNATAFANRAGLFFKTSKFMLALNDINKAEELDPNNSLIHFNKGNIFLELRETDKALEQYSKAIQIDSSCQSAYQNRSVIYYKLGNISMYNSDIKKVNELKINSKK